jgi:hypothetical protein
MFGLYPGIWSIYDRDGVFDASKIIDLVNLRYLVGMFFSPVPYNSGYYLVYP